MTIFLEKTAEYIYGKYGEAVSDLCIVLPNRRGGLFLKKSLSAIICKTIWSPEIFSIEDFISRLSGFRLEENTRLLFELFEVHKEIEGKDAQPFEDFFSWGQQLLHDFNEIDSYLADPEQLFGYLSEARALSLWNLDLKPLTDFQKKYLRFYNSLFTYYTKLSDRLLPGKQVYAGLLLRQAADQIEGTTQKMPWPKIIFAGFNALTKAEEIIISALVSSGKAELIWDADKYYLLDENQEAGEFLRNWTKKWKSGDFHWIENDFATQPKKITVTGVPYNIGQVKYCGEILSGIREMDVNTEDTAVVLMDEQLLVPLLNSLPENVKALNITMGLSLKQSTYFSLFDAIFQMHENMDRFQRSSKDSKTRFYFRDVLRILQHPSLIQLSESHTKENRSIFEEVVGIIKSGSRIFLGKEEIIPASIDLFQLDLSFLDPVFSHFREPLDAIDCMKKMIVQMRDSTISTFNENTSTGQNSGANIQLEFLFGFSNVIHQVESLMKKYDAVKNLKTLHQLFTRISETTTLPFYGEPLKGLQIMGMLETRTLDFKNLIMLSVNEDLIPSGKTTHSFIPFDIRKSFHLPTYQHKNAVYAYHFYRLLQRAEVVNLLYNTEPDELGGGEKSRFIKQIQQELSIYNPGITITDQIISAPPAPGRDFQPIKVEKTGDIMALLKEKAARGLAPTSLNSYRRCRLQFYFSAIAGIEEQKELEDTIDPQVLGQAVHEVLNLLYKPFLDQPLTSDAILSMIPLIPSLMDKAFEKKFNGSDLAYGKNLLLVNVANIMTRNFLYEERRNVEKLLQEGGILTVKFLEERLTKLIQFQLPEGVVEIRLKGFVDRVDQLRGIIRIIDYKTGLVDKKELVLKGWTDLSDDPGMDKCFQLLMYAYLLNDAFRITDATVEAGIISLKRVKSGFLTVALPVGNDGLNTGIDNKSLKNFEEILFWILQEMFDPQVPFDQTENQDICKWCPYINLCGR